MQFLELKWQFCWFSKFLPVRPLSEISFVFQKAKKCLPTEVFALTSFVTSWRHWSELIRIPLTMVKIIFFWNRFLLLNSNKKFDLLKPSVQISSSHLLWFRWTVFLELFCWEVWHRHSRMVESRCLMRSTRIQILLPPLIFFYMFTFAC